MRIGLYLTGTAELGVSALEERARRAEASGFSTLWLGQTSDYDALTLAGLLGRATERIGLGTWVVPSPTRHPLALAQAALTAQAACRGRLRLGIGVGHPALLERRLGIEIPSPIAYMRATLEVLDPLLRGLSVAREGPIFTARGGLQIPEAQRPELLLAALQPRMLALAGAASDGAALWLANARHLRETAVPTLREAAARAGRPPPRVVCGLPVVVTDDPEAARASVARWVGPSARLPSYRAVLRMGGARAPEDVALVGNESELAEHLQELAAVGVDELNALVVPERGMRGSVERTTDFLAEHALRSA